jgi:hypothetical protein
MSTDKIETTIASIMPVIPKKFPILEVSGDDSPLSANINNTPVIKNNIEDKLADIIYFSFFLYICNILWVTKKPPKMLIAAKVTATNPNMFEKDMPLPSNELKEAMMAPTIITEEIALVTDIKGV